MAFFSPFMGKELTKSFLDKPYNSIESFPLKFSSVKKAALVPFTEEMLNGKLHFLCTSI